MKKFLSIVLALTMVLSCCAFAAPMTVETAQNTDEVIESAPVCEEEAAAEVAVEEENLIYHFTFDDWDSTTIADDAQHNIKDEELAATNKASVSFDDMTLRISGVNGVESGYQGNATNAVKVVEGTWKRPRLIKESNWPTGSYTVKLRVYSDTAANSFGLCFDGGVQQGARSIASGSWTTLTYNFEVGSDGFAVYDGVKQQNMQQSNGTIANTTPLSMISIPTSSGNSAWHFDDLKLYYTPAAEENLIYNIDFSKLTTDDIPQATQLNLDDLDANGGANAPDSFDGAYLFLRNNSNPSITGNYMTFSPTTNDWHRWYLYPGSAGFPEGDYTLKTYVKAAASSNYTYTINVGGEDQYGTTSVGTSWTEVICEFTVTDSEDGKKILKYKDQEKTGTFLFTSFAAMNHSTSWGVGYVKVYYKPFTTTSKDYTLTFKANGENVADFEQIIPAGSERVQDLSGYTMDGDTGRFLGWATTPAGETVTSVNVTECTTLYAIWDENYYASAGDYLNAGELIATYDFNNFTENYVSNSLNDLQKFANINTSSKYVTGTTGNYTYSLVDCVDTGTVNHRLFPFFLSGTSNTAADGTLLADAGKDNDLVLVDTRTGTGLQHRLRIGVCCTKGYDAWASKFADGLYTFAGEVMVEENADIVKVQLGSFIQAEVQKETSNNPQLVPVGKKTYIKKSILVKDGCVYDYDTMECFYTGTGKVVNIAPIFFVTNSAPTSVKIHVDNMKVFYNEDTDSLKSFAENSIRTDDNAGIRFMASVANTLKADKKTTEYGFIVTRSSLLESAGIAADEFTFESNVAKVSGVSYGADVDKIYRQEDYRTYFTGVIVGMPVSKANYTEDFVVRPYFKYDGETVYGDAMSRSIYDTALALKAAGYPDLDADGIQKVDDIIELCK